MNRLVRLFTESLKEEIESSNITVDDIRREALEYHDFLVKTGKIKKTDFIDSDIIDIIDDFNDSTIEEIQKTRPEVYWQYAMETLKSSPDWHIVYMAIYKLRKEIAKAFPGEPDPKEKID